jgi:photosystem II stability/assembly factor-like uncharacterized protein
LLLGTLVADGRWGIGIRAEVVGGVIGVAWPHGYSARPGPPIEVLDETGRVVAREGDAVTLPGGQDTDGLWRVCPGLEPATLPAGSPSPYLTGSVGFSGSAAWVVSDGSLLMSLDGGRSWSAVHLPAGLAPSAVVAVSVAAGRPVLLATLESNGVRLYRKSDSDSGWLSTLLVPSWTAADGVSGQPIETVLISPGPGGLVTVALTIGIGTSAAAESLFVSTDDGKSFAEHKPKAGVASAYWHSITFVSPKLGVVGAGPATQAAVFLLYTSNGGLNWAEASIAGLPTVDHLSLGRPAIVGPDIEVPMTTWPDNGSASFSMLVSHDGGATFATMGTALPVGTDIDPVTDTLGQVTWAMSSVAGLIYETDDGARTWTSVAPAGLPLANEIHLTGPTSATAVVWEGGCTGVKTGCWQRNYLVATSDGGRTWTRL